MRLIRHARTAGFVVLAVVTVFGLYQFFTGDWSEIAGYWEAKLSALPQVLVLATLDVALEGVAWLWIYAGFGLRVWDTKGASAFLAGRAGLLLPAQLGRLIRPDAMARLDRAPLATCLKAEGVVFVLDSTSVAALLAGLIAYMLHPLAAPVAAGAVIVLMLLLGNRVANRLAGTKLELPTTFWWRWQTFGIVIVEMAGWFAHGAALYLLVRGLPGSSTLGQSVFFAAGSAVLGAGSGLPGGLGATEGLLGASLSLMNVPAAHLAIAVAGFRLVTFWMWIPVGWIALMSIRRRSANATGAPAPAVR